MRKLGEELELPKLTFPVILEHDCNAGSKERNTQGHPGRIEALAPIGHH
jgi:hypothetical protein